MQEFLKYAREPSNYADFSAIFDEQAKFKFDRPAQTRRKVFFEEQFSTNIMNNFYKYLLLQKLLPGSSQQEIANNIDSGAIDHNDIVDAFFSWLQDDTTVFIVIEKAKNEPKQHFQYSNINIGQNQQPKGPSKAQQAKKDPAYNDKSRNPNIPKEVKKEPMPLNHNYPYNITKIQPSPSKPEQKIDPHVPYIAGKPTHIPKPQMAVPPQVHKPAPYHPHPQVVHYQNQQEQRPWKIRFYEKLADSLEYPERWNTIKGELNTLMIAKRN